MSDLKVYSLPIHLVDKSSTHELSQSNDKYIDAILLLQHTDKHACALKVPDQSAELSLDLLSLVDDLQDSFHDPSYRKPFGDEESQEEDKDTVKGRENFNHKLYCARMHLLSRDPSAQPSAMTLNSAVSKIKVWSKGFRPAGMSFKELYTSLCRFNKPECDGGVVGLDEESAPSEMNEYFKKAYPDSVGKERKCLLRNQLDILLHVNPDLKINMPSTPTTRCALAASSVSTSLEEMIASVIQKTIGDFLGAQERPVALLAKHSVPTNTFPRNVSSENTLAQQREVVAKARVAAELAQQSLDALEELHALEASEDRSNDVMTFEDDDTLVPPIRPDNERPSTSSARVSQLHTLLAEVNAVQAIVVSKGQERPIVQEETTQAKKPKMRDTAALHNAPTPVATGGVPRLNGRRRVGIPPRYNL